MKRLTEDKKLVETMVTNRKLIVSTCLIYPFQGSENILETFLGSITSSERRLECTKRLWLLQLAHCLIRFWFAGLKRFHSCFIINLFDYAYCISRSTCYLSAFMQSGKIQYYEATSSQCLRPLTVSPYLFYLCFATYRDR